MPAVDPRSLGISIGANLVVLAVLAFFHVSLAGQKTALRDVLQVDTEIEVREDIFESRFWVAEPQPALRQAGGGAVRAANDASVSDLTRQSDLGEALAGLNRSTADPGDMLGQGSIAEGIGGGGGADVGSADFFGAASKGQRFLYVIDRSFSMLFNNKAWFSARDELLKSLESLSPTMEFQVYFYNTEVEALDLPGRTLAKASYQNKKRAREQILKLRPEGGTDHEKALRKALDAYADVIFFLTDADDEGNEAAQITMIKEMTVINHRKRGLRSKPATIHVIQFQHDVTRKPVQTIKLLAESNKGTYRFFDTNQFPEGR